MARYIYEKVLLYAYPKMGELAEAISAGVEVKAALSFREAGDPFALAERIADEILRRRKLLAAEKMLDETLSGLGEEELFLLEYKYFRRKKNLRGKFAGRTVECSERSYFRRQNALLSRVSQLLAARGWSEERFLEEFGDNDVLMRLFRALEEGRERALVAKRAHRGIRFRPQNSGASSGAGDGFLPRRINTASNAAATHKRQITAICAGESPSGAGSAGSAGPA